jgi:voltage-gated sodium channel
MLTPAHFINDVVPVKLLRLIRLLRLFRLARSFEKLKSIVEALLAGIAAVGWILVMTLFYTYSVASFCALFFRASDPFHFGTISRSMVSILRIATLDDWQDIMYSKSGKIISTNLFADD